MIRLAIHDPKLLSSERRAAQFAARDHVLSELTREFEQSEPDRIHQHRLVVGPAGSGKTMLLSRFGDGAEALHADFETGIAGLLAFWNALLGAAGLAPAENVDAAVRSLVDFADRRGGSLALVCDAFDRVLATLDESAWALRATLSETPQFVLVGSASRLPPSTIDYEAPFFDFFAIHTLQPLDITKSAEVLRAIASDVDPKIAAAFEQHPEHTQAVAKLCGGNPRMLALTVEALVVHGTQVGVFECLDHICDRLTPQFRQTLDSISSQARIVLRELALHWHPAHAKTVAARLGMPTNKVSTYLDRLSRDGLVEKVPMPPGKTIGFQLCDRMCNLWFLLRADATTRARVHALTRLVLGEEGNDRGVLMADVGNDAPRERLAVELREL